MPPVLWLIICVALLHITRCVYGRRYLHIFCIHSVVVPLSTSEQSKYPTSAHALDPHSDTLLRVYAAYDYGYYMRQPSDLERIPVRITTHRRGLLSCATFKSWSWPDSPYFEFSDPRRRSLVTICALTHLIRQCRRHSLCPRVKRLKTIHTLIHTPCDTRSGTPVYIRINITF